MRIYRVILPILVVLLAGTAVGGQGKSEARRHLIYLHGRIVQERQSARPDDPQFGYYQLEPVLLPFPDPGFRAPCADRLKSDLDRLRSQAAADKESLTAKLTETERMLAELKLGFSADRQQFESVATRQRTALAACSERNARMYQLGNDLLDKYEEKSCVSAILQAEPFTGLKRAQIEKMIEEERENLDKDVLNPVKTAEVARQDQ